MKLPILTDDEYDRRVRANLEAFYDPDPKPISQCKALGEESPEADRFLALFDEEAPKPRTAKMSPVLRKMIAAKLEEVSQFRAENREPYLTARREQARREYANERAAEGLKVRPYKNRPTVPGESALDRKRRLHRDRARGYAGKDEATVRSYLSLSELSPEEKAARKRQQDAESKRKQCSARKARKRETASAKQS